MDEIETQAPLADAPQQQAAADARVAASVDATERATAAEISATAAAPLAASFAARIAAAKFEHREQGHDETMKLLDEMYAAIERLEVGLVQTTTATYHYSDQGIPEPQQPGESDADYAARTSG